MLNIIFGRENVPKDKIPITTLNSPWFFYNNKKPEWFEDPFIQECISTIDHATVITGEVIRDYRGISVSTELLSTGTKTLCCLYYHPERIFFGSLLGDNCLPLLVRISEKQDITIVLEHYADFKSEDIEKNTLCVNGKVLDEYGYEDAFIDWSESTEREDYEERLLNSGL